MVKHTERFDYSLHRVVTYELWNEQLELWKEQ